MLNTFISKFMLKINRNYNLLYVYCIADSGYMKLREIMKNLSPNLETMFN